MTWLQILAQAAVMATFLGIGIAIAAYFNGKHIKEGVENLGKMMKDSSKETREILERMDKRAEEHAKETRELFERMDRRAEERHKEVVVMLKPRGKKMKEG